MWTPCCRPFPARRIEFTEPVVFTAPMRFFHWIRHAAARRGARGAALCLAALAAIGNGAASAAPYRMELVVFAREDGEAVPEEPARLACLERAQPIAAEGTGGELPHALPAARHLLVKEAQAIRRRGSGFQLLLHAAWEQDIVEGKAAPWLRLPPAAGVEGCLRARLKKGPEIEIVLSYLPNPADQYRTQFKRQLRPGEVSYLDDPAIGVLVRVDPLGGENPAVIPAASAPSAGASPSAPVTPAPADAPPGIIPPPPKKPFRW